MDSYSINTCRICLKATGDISLYDKYEEHPIIELLSNVSNIPVSVLH